MNRYVETVIIAVAIMLSGWLLHPALSQTPAPQAPAPPAATPSAPGMTWFPVTSATPNGALVYELQQKLGATATTYDNGVLVTIPSGVTNAQVQQVITAWSPSDTIPPTPAASAQSQLQNTLQQAGGWSNLSAAQKDTVEKLVVQILVNQTQ